MKVTGSLYVKNGIYQMMVRVPDKNGKTKQISKTTGVKVEGKNQREARANKLLADRTLANYISSLEAQDHYSGDVLLTVAIETWLEKKKKTLRQDTYEAYRCAYTAHLMTYFKPLHLTLEQVTPRTIAKYTDTKLEEGQSANSIRKHLVILNGVYKEALRYGEVRSNPCTDISVKDDRDEFEGQAYTPETAKKLLSAVKNDPIEPAVYLGLYLGLRRSEVIGLRWSDVDFEGNVVHVRNTVVRFSTISEQEKTKNHTSRRDLYLPLGLKNYLLDLKNSPGENFGKTSHICQWPDGKTYQPDYISRRFHKVLERSGLPMIRFHDLRHTAGSMLINNGQSILQVQNFLGHKKASTTLNIYSHIYLEGKKQTAELLDDLLDGRKEKRP